MINKTKYIALLLFILFLNGSISCSSANKVAENKSIEQLEEDRAKQKENTIKAHKKAKKELMKKQSKTVRKRIRKSNRKRRKEARKKKRFSIF